MSSFGHINAEECYIFGNNILNTTRAFYINNSSCDIQNCELFTFDYNGIQLHTASTGYIGNVYITDVINGIEATFGSNVTIGMAKIILKSIGTNRSAIRSRRGSTLLATLCNLSEFGSGGVGYDSDLGGKMHIYQSISANNTCTILSTPAIALSSTGFNGFTMFDKNGSYITQG